MAGKYYNSKKQFPLMTVVILAAVILLIKPIIKFITGISSGLGGLLGGLGSIGNKSADGVSTLLESIGLADTPAAKAAKKAIEDKTSYWSPDFHKKAPKGSLLMKHATCEKLYLDIHSCWGLFSDDFGKLKKLFRDNFRTQSQFSFFCDYMQRVNGIAFNKYLLGFMPPNDRLDDNELGQLDTMIKALPKHKT